MTLHTLIKFVDNLINTRHEEKNQVTVKNIEKIKINFQKWMILMIG